MACLYESKLSRHDIRTLRELGFLNITELPCKFKGEVKGLVGERIDASDLGARGAMVFVATSDLEQEVVGLHSVNDITQYVVTQCGQVLLQVAFLEHDDREKKIKKLFRKLRIGDFTGRLFSSFDKPLQLISGDLMARMAKWDWRSPLATAMRTEL